MADNVEEKDVPMEDVTETEVDEDELLGTKKEVEKKGKKEEKVVDDKKVEDDETASEAEFNQEDDRIGMAEEEQWTWHIELYPISPEDVQLDNFVKLVTTSTQSHVLFRTNEKGQKRGEAHFYTHDDSAAKTLVRTVCCRKFSIIRPYVYLYYRSAEGVLETASLRLDLIEAAKMRWDRQRKNAGEPTTRVAKVSQVPLSTSKEFLNVLFARAFHIRRESDESEAKAVEAMKNAKSEEKSKSAEGKDEEEDKEENNDEDEEELVGEFNGNLTIDCVSRTSLKGFLLGYRKVYIGDNQLEIKALAAEEFKMEALRKEVREKRLEETKREQVWKGAKAIKDDDKTSSPKVGNKDGRGRGARGARGGRGDHRGGSAGGRGGIMTGRQKMEEKMRRGGGRDMRGGGRGGYMPRDDMQYEMAMNTYRLERQMISMQGRGGMGHRGGFRDYHHPDPYMARRPMAPVGYDDYGPGDGYDPMDDWGYRGGGGMGPRFGMGMGMGRIPMRGMRGRRA